jgi:uncharacterized alkaline shock family protein YloU
MAEETAERQSRSSGRGGSSGGVGEDALQSGRGTTTIADGVVSKVAGLAAREVSGVHALGGGAARALGGMTAAVGLDQKSQGVTVQVGETETAVDLTIVVDYGESIPQVSQAVRDNVVKRIEGITGLRATEVNVAVNDLYFPGEDEGQDQG